MSCDPGYSPRPRRARSSGGVFVAAMAACSSSAMISNRRVAAWSRRCCSPWDYLIMSADDGRAGPYNGGTALPVDGAPLGGCRHGFLWHEFAPPIVDS
jgi:hypothetical protein